jgi:hypothetical protein
MSARIAPEPVSAGSHVVGDYRPRTTKGDSPTADTTTTASGSRQHSMQLQKTSSAADILPPLPTPPKPPGSAFAVALMTGQLQPRPTSVREMQMRLGSAELPAQGSLALHDKRV